MVLNVYAKAIVPVILIALPVSSASNATDSRPSQGVGVVTKRIGLTV